MSQTQLMIALWSLMLLQDVPIILGDIQDQASLDKLASQSSVVMATAGPFAKHGTPVVDACVRAGADYCDITGALPSWPCQGLQSDHCLQSGNCLTGLWTGNRNKAPGLMC